MTKPWSHVEYIADEPGFLDGYFTIKGRAIAAVRVQIDPSGNVHTQTFTDDDSESELAPFDVERLTSGEALLVRPCVVEALREVDR